MSAPPRYSIRLNSTCDASTVFATVQACPRLSMRTEHLGGIRHVRNVDSDHHTFACPMYPTSPESLGPHRRTACRNRISQLISPNRMISPTVGPFRNQFPRPHNQLPRPETGGTQHPRTILRHRRLANRIPDTSPPLGTLPQYHRQRHRSRPPMSDYGGRWHSSYRFSSDSWDH